MSCFYDISRNARYTIELREPLIMGLCLLQVVHQRFFVCVRNIYQGKFDGKINILRLEILNLIIHILVSRHDSVTQTTARVQALCSIWTDKKAVIDQL